MSEPGPRAVLAAPGLHQEVALRILKKQCKTQKESHRAAAAATEAAKALWGFLDSVADAYLDSAAYRSPVNA